MKICYRDWKDLNDKFDRIEAMVEMLVEQGNDKDAARTLAAEVKAHTAALDAATPKT